MRQITTNVYKFNELSERAQECALGWGRGAIDYHWHQENRDSLEAFVEYFRFTLRNWEYSTDRYSYDLILSDVFDWQHLEGVRLWKFFHNNNYQEELLDKACPFTGYHVDEAFLEPFRQFMKRPDTTWDFEYLMKMCCESGFTAMKQAMEDYYSDEQLADHFGANDYEFTVDGEFVK